LRDLFKYSITVFSSIRPNLSSSCANFSFDELSEDKELHKIMGDILTEILWSKVEEKELQSKTEIEEIKDFDI
jgi:hypothetical protein